MKNKDSPDGVGAQGILKIAGRVRADEVGHDPRPVRLDSERLAVNGQPVLE